MQLRMCGIFETEVERLDYAIITYILPRLMYYRDHGYNCQYDQEYSDQIGTAILTLKDYLNATYHGEDENLYNYTMQGMHDFIDIIPSLRE